MIFTGGIDPVVALAICLTLALIFATSAAHKLRNFAKFRQTAADYQLLPSWSVPIVSVALTACEALAVCALLLPATRNAGLLLASALLAVYALAIGINLLRGRRGIDCGCSVGLSEQPISGWLVARNMLLAFAALAGLSSLTRSLGVLDYGVAICAALACGLLYTAGNQLLANAPHLNLLRRRYE